MAVTTRSMAITKVFVDHLRLLSMLLPLGACTVLPIRFAAWTVPLTWASTTKDLRPLKTNCPLWMYVTLIVARAITVQAALFFELTGRTVPILILKMHALASLMYLSLFLALKIWTWCGFPEHGRIVVTEKLHIVY